MSGFMSPAGTVALATFRWSEAWGLADCTWFRHPRAGITAALWIQLSRVFIWPADSDRSVTVAARDGVDSQRSVPCGSFMRSTARFGPSGRDAAHLELRPAEALQSLRLNIRQILTHW